MRLVSYNVRSLRDDAHGVANVLRALAPDVVCVQEAPRLLRWRQACARLARLSDLLLVTGGRTAAGNLLLVAPRVRVRASYEVLLPRPEGMHRRGAVVADVACGGVEARVLGTHLDLDRRARVASARTLRAHGATVVAGDLNEEPGGEARALLAEGLLDVALPPTFPTRAPRRRIDAVLVAPELRVVGTEVVRTGPVTDHLPVVVDLEPA